MAISYRGHHADKVLVEIDEIFKNVLALVILTLRKKQRLNMMKFNKDQQGSISSESVREDAKKHNPHQG